MKNDITKTRILDALLLRGHVIIKSLSQVQHIMEYNGTEYFLVLLSKSKPGDFNNLKRLEHCVDQRHLDASVHYDLPTYIIVLETLAQKVLIGNLETLDIRGETINNVWVNSFARKALTDITQSIGNPQEPIAFQFTRSHKLNPPELAA